MLKLITASLLGLATTASSAKDTSPFKMAFINDIHVTEQIDTPAVSEWHGFLEAPYAKLTNGQDSKIFLREFYHNITSDMKQIIEYKKKLDQEKPDLTDEQR